MYKQDIEKSSEIEGFVVIFKDGTYGRIGEVFGDASKPDTVLLSTADLHMADVWPLLKWESQLRKLKDNRQSQNISSYLPATGRRVVTLKPMDDNSTAAKAG